MSFFDAFIALAAIYFIFRTATQMWGLGVSLNYLKQAKHRCSNAVRSAACGRTNAIIILIPVLEETAVIDATCQHYASFPKQLLNVVRIIFITSEKEGAPDGNPTHACLRRLLIAPENIIHCPLKTGGKAQQINYALDLIADDIRTSEKAATYIAVFDADSLPDYRGIEYVVNDTGRSVIYQMLATYTCESAKYRGLAFARAVIQTRWSLSFELANLCANFTKNRMIFLMYIVGHGIFIRQDHFEAKPFSTCAITEDIEYGYVQAISGIFAHPVPYFDSSQIAPTCKAAVKQSARWFAGDITALVSVCKISSPGDYKHILARFLRLCDWIFGPPVLVAAVGIAIFKQIPGGLLLIPALFLYIRFLHRPVERQFFMHPSDGIRARISFVVALLINCAGPLLGCWYLFLGGATLANKLFIKTPRY